MPIEISFTLRDAMDEESVNRLIIYWRVYYWFNFLNGWLIVPIACYNCYCGAFSKLQNIKRSILKYLKFFIYTLTSVFIGALLVRLIFKK